MESKKEIMELKLLKEGHPKEYTKEDLFVIIEQEKENIIYSRHYLIEHLKLVLLGLELGYDEFDLGPLRLEKATIVKSYPEETGLGILASQYDLFHEDQIKFDLRANFPKKEGE